MKENRTFKINEVKTTPYVGGYQIDSRKDVENSLRLMFVKKPSIINRFFCRILLGWVWIDDI